MCLYKFTTQVVTFYNTGREDIDAFNAEHYEQEGLVQFVIDSVYALAHAIDSLRRVKCPKDVKNCLRRSYLNGEDVLQYIRNVSFLGMFSCLSVLVQLSLYIYI